MKRQEEDTPTLSYTLQNDTILRTCRGEKTDHVPVWMMRQAGRYLPEFQEVRKEIDFFTLCETPHLAAEITIQPLKRYNLDAVIIFSDILVIPQAMGFKIEMKPGVGPVFLQPLKDISDVEKIPRPQIASSLSYVYEAIRETLRLLKGKVPLIGFCGAPWTLLSYMIEGKGSKTWSTAKQWLYCHPDVCHKLLANLTDYIVEHLTLQANAGASLLQVFDSWAGILSPQQFATFSLPYLEDIAKRVHKVHPNVPLILFAKGVHYIDLLKDTEYDVVSLDWTMDPKMSRDILKGKVLQGNLDPCALYSNPEDVQKLTGEMIDAFGTEKYIANLGHGLYPDIDPKHVGVFVDAVHSISKEKISQKNK